MTNILDFNAAHGRRQERQHAPKSEFKDVVELRHKLVLAGGAAVLKSAPVHSSDSWRVVAEADASLERLHRAPADNQNYQSPPAGDTVLQLARPALQSVPAPVPTSENVSSNVVNLDDYRKNIQDIHLANAIAGEQVSPDLIHDNSDATIYPFLQDDAPQAQSQQEISRAA